MKIGILTLHSAHNFGAVLQAYALKRFLSEHRHEVDIINYQPRVIRRWYSINPIYALRRRNIKRALVGFKNSVKFYSQRRRRYLAFESFINKNLTGAPCLYSAKEISELKFDVIIFGSDQLWASFTKFDKAYWGVFNTTAKKVAYAISGANFDYLSKNANFVRKALKDFYTISVREPKLKESISEYTDKEIRVDLDPTLIAYPKIWDEICAKAPKEKKNNFVLLYQISQSEHVTKAAYSYAKKKMCDVVELCTEIYYPTTPQRDYFAGPAEFLRYFRDASLVITTSFHGIAFSIINKKSFYFVRRGGSSENRIINILNRFGLQNRILEEGQDVPLEDDLIPYNEVEEKMIDDILKSRQYLLDTINSIKS